MHSVDPDCPLSNIIPEKKNTTQYQLRNESVNPLEITTVRFKNVFVNTLIFRYNLLSFYYLYTVCLRYIIYYYIFYLLLFGCLLIWKRNKDWLIDWLIDSLIVLVWRTKNHKELPSNKRRVIERVLKILFQKFKEFLLI